MNWETKEVNGVILEKKRLNKMIFRIIGAERVNQKLKNDNDAEMVTKIQRFIEEEVKCL